MCGLAGLVQVGGESPETTGPRLTAALEALSRRGPDASRVWQPQFSRVGP